jgi:hypothetical protein
VRTFFAVGGQRRLCWWCWSDWLRKVRTIPNTEEIPVSKPKEWDWYNMIFLAAVVLLILSLLPSSCHFHIQITQKPSGEPKHEERTNH